MGHFLPHALPQCLRFKHAVTLVTSASSFARNEYVQNVINNFVFVFLHPMGDFFLIEHASFALKGPQRFHTSDSVALPEHFRLHYVFGSFILLLFLQSLQYSTECLTKASAREKPQLPY